MQGGDEQIITEPATPAEHKFHIMAPVLDLSVPA